MAKFCFDRCCCDVKANELKIGEFGHVLVSTTKDAAPGDVLFNCTYGIHNLNGGMSMATYETDSIMIDRLEAGEQFTVTV